MAGEYRDPEFDAFVERVLELKRCLPELAAVLAELDEAGYDLLSRPGLKDFPPAALEAMRQFSRGKLTEGEMFYQVVNVLFP